jgi:glycerol-3-phosphate acyltransferase PlsY
MPYVFIALSLVLGYLIGSFPSAYVVARLRKGIDIRQVGSRNMGAMNVFYSVGFGYGILVLALDIGKGAAAVAIARAMGTPDLIQLLAGLAAVVGHNFPVFLNFKGGRGVV